MTYEIFGIHLNIGQYICLFIACQLVNVALSTVKTVVMYRENKIASANINAISHGFNAIIVVMTASELPLWITILIYIVTNWIGVYSGMWFLEKVINRHKHKLWEIVATIPYNIEVVEDITIKLTNNDISFNVTETFNQKEHTIYMYSKNKDESRFIKEYVLNPLGDNVKYIVHEEKVKM